MQKADHFTTTRLLNHKPSGSSRGGSTDCSLCPGKHCSLGLLSTHPCWTFNSFNLGLHQCQTAPTQRQQQSEGTSDHLERAQTKSHLVLQPSQIADPSKLISPLFDHPASLHNYCCRNYWWLHAPRQSWDHVWISARVILEELESISSFPVGWQSSWQAIVRAQLEMQLIHQIIIICSKALVPGGHPVIVYFCKKRLFWITE